MDKIISSKEIKTKRNHIVVTAITESRMVQKEVERTIKKAARKLRKLTGGEVSYELSVICQDNTDQEE